MCASVLLLLVAAMPALAGPRGAAGGEGGVSVVAGPAFADAQQVAVLARVGDSAAMHCRVLRLADRVVSWVRSSDLQILTHAGYVFTADSRVSCSEGAGAGAGGGEGGEEGGAGEVLEEPYAAGAVSVHTLRIARLREADQGRYECQINTEPKLSLFFNLTVIEESLLPTVSVRALGAGGGAGGAGVVWGALGGAARLACEARYEPAPAPHVLAALPPLRIRWTHDAQPIDTQSSRGGVSLDTERWAARALSRLTLGGLRARDAGRYACEAHGRRAAVTLRVRADDDYSLLEAEAEGEMERMQRDEVSSRAARSVSVVSLARLAPLALALLLT